MDNTTHTTELETQAGGHEGAFRKTSDGHLMKVTCDAERIFYKTLASRNFPPEIQAFFPPYYGEGTIKGRECIIMGDLTLGMEHPSVLDIKMGTSTMAPDADDNPIKKELTIAKDKLTTTHSLGFRIVGAKIYKRNTNSYETYEKEWSRTLHPETMQAALTGYFHDGEKLRKDVCRHYVEPLKRLAAWFKTQNHIKLFASSLLFVYDGASVETKAIVKMIDFAHVWPLKENEIDEGYLFGIEHLIKYFEAILDSTTSSSNTLALVH